MKWSVWRIETHPDKPRCFGKLLGVDECLRFINLIGRGIGCSAIGDSTIVVFRPTGVVSDSTASNSNKFRPPPRVAVAIIVGSARRTSQMPFPVGR
jgi:hypothetical protein